MVLKKQWGSFFGETDLPANALHKQLQTGQILLIVILAAIVTSTIGLSLASRSITSLRSSTEEAESQKALAAAEAGIERVIQKNIPINIPSTNLGNNSSYATQIISGDSSNFLINGGNMIPKNEGFDVWFAEHNADGDPDVSTAKNSNFVFLYWGESPENCGESIAPAAIQAIIVTSDGDNTTTHRFAYDPCDRENNFTLVTLGSYSVGGKTFMYSTPQGGSGDLVKGGDVKKIVFMRIIPIYKDAVVGISTCNRGGGNCTELPSQGYIITSIGKSGQTNRKIRVFKGYPQTYLPYLSYGLFVAN